MSIPLASKRTKISWGFIFALWALLLSAPLVAAGEPEYERKPVSHWLSILRNPSAGSTNREAIGAAFRQANAAVLSIGPAALPYLAEDLDDRESVFVQGYRKLRQQLPFSGWEKTRLTTWRLLLVGWGKSGFPLPSPNPPWINSSATALTRSERPRRRP